APVGIIGLGTMGLPIAKRLLDRGMRIIGFDISRAPLDALAGQVHVAPSLRDVADNAEIVLGCLPDNETFRAAIVGQNGALGGRRMSHYVHLGTSGVTFVEELAAELSPDVSLVDAPIIGGARRAREGTLTVVASGSSASVAA